MGRPLGSKNRTMVKKLARIVPAAIDNRTDAGIIIDVTEAFSIAKRMVFAACEGIVTSVIMTGAPGVGKSFCVEQVLEAHKLKNPDARCKVIHGNLLAMDLYHQASQYANKGDVLVIDDCDGIFDNIIALNILKALLDTSEHRVVSWLSNHVRVTSGDIPSEFIYNGSIIFLSNINMQYAIDNKMANHEHLMALRDRAICLDLSLHTRREIALWVGEVVRTNRILQGMGLTEQNEIDAIAWLNDNRDRLAALSIRTAKQIGTFMLMGMETWMADARHTLLRKGV